MSEQLMAEIAALQERETYFTKQLEDIAAAEILDEVKYNAMKTELENVQAKLEAKLADQAAIEQAAQAATEEVMSSFDNIVIPGTGMAVSLTELANNEAPYDEGRGRRFLSAYIQNLVAEAEIRRQSDLVAMKSTYEAENNSLREELAEANNKLEQSEVEKKALEDENYQYKIDNEDLRKRLDNSAEVIAEKDEEINRLAAELAALREQISKPAVPTQTNTNADLAAIAKEIEAAKIPIVNARWKDDIKRTTRIAELAKTGETIEFSWTEKGKYREVTAEEAEQFRQQHEQEQQAGPAETEPVAEVTQPSVDLTPPALQFPEETVPDAGSNVSETEPSLEVPGQAKTIEERVAALEAAVFGKKVAA